MQGLYKLVFSYPKMFSKFSNFLILLILPYPRRVNRFRKPLLRKKGERGYILSDRFAKIRCPSEAILLPCSSLRSRGELVFGRWPTPFGAAPWTERSGSR
jgi:hypothetical protein